MHSICARHTPQVPTPNYNASAARKDVFHPSCTAAPAWHLPTTLGFVCRCNSCCGMHLLLPISVSFIAAAQHLAAVDSTRGSIKQATPSVNNLVQPVTAH